MKKQTYFCGVPGNKYGMWHKVSKTFSYGICEDTPALADARLYQIKGLRARELLRGECEARPLPVERRT